MATRADFAHLLRRATFGPTAEEVDAAEKAGLEYVVAGLVAPATPDVGAARSPIPALGLDPVLSLANGATDAQRQAAQQLSEKQIQQITMWWLDRMVTADQQFVEKLIFFWHGHWATAVEKVSSAQAMMQQQRVFRELGHGDFAVFTKAMLRDPALIFWLDGQRNTRQAPNENLARELMELFTLGIGNYTETDVKQGAKALTGWQIDRMQATATLNAARHDTRNKTILGKTGNFGADEFVDILMSQPANADFVVGRLWFRFVSGNPIPPDTRDALVDAYNRSGRNITALAKAMFLDANFPWARGQLVKQPVEWLVGALRQLGLRFADMKSDDQLVLSQGLDAMGQLPFDPPSVGGWPADAAWLTTSATTTRLRLADLLATRLPATTAAKLTAVPTGQRVDVLARLLVVDGFTPRTRAALTAIAGDLHKLVALGLASPEYTIC